MMKHEFTRYETYKDSGVEWLGNIPTHWNMMRLKDLSDIQNSNVDKISDDNEIPVRLCNYIDVYNNEFINSSINFMQATADKSEIKRFTVRKNDVFITKDSETSDDIAIPALATEFLEGVLCGYHLAQIRTKEKMLLGAYLFRLFQSKKYGFRFVIFSKGITRVGLGQSSIADSLTPVPSLPEQKTIAYYLETITEQIDRKIDLLQQKATKYSELKQSLIKKTVTRGLDNAVETKDSGIDWIGEVPVHWSVHRIADIAIQNKVKNSGLFEKNLLSLSYGHIIRKDFNTSFGLLPASFETYQVVKAAIVILRLTDLQNDQKSLRVGHVLEKGIITSAYLGLRFKHSINSVFAYYLLHVYDLCKVFYWFGGGLRSTMRFDDIKVIPFIIPPFKEQSLIADYLDTKTAQIDHIVETINVQIDKLKELRKTIVNDVVTGKIKVASEGEAA
jgi:type I restriction enzyme S subunit